MKDELRSRQTQTYHSSAGRNNQRRAFVEKSVGIREEEGMGNQKKGELLSKQGTKFPWKRGRTGGWEKGSKQRKYFKMEKGEL